MNNNNEFTYEGKSVSTSLNCPFSGHSIITPYLEKELLFNNLSDVNTMQPNPEVVGIPSTNKNIFLSRMEHKTLNKPVEYSNQHMGAVHPSLCYKDFNVMKICTIILISMMTLALKVLDMFTLSMGTLIFESVSQVALCTAHPASPKKHLQQSGTTNAALCLWGSTGKIFNTQPK